MSQATASIDSTSLTSKRPAWAGLDWILGGLSRLAGLTVIVMLASVLIVLFASALPSIRAFGGNFLFTGDWRPNALQRPLLDEHGKAQLDADGQVKMVTVPPAFGALPVIYGTLASSAIALFLAIPASLGGAVFLVRIATRRLAIPISFLVEFLAAIPSIAYGIWGLFILVPFLQRYVEPGFVSLCTNVPGLGWMVHETIRGRSVLIPATGHDLLCAGLVLAIMVVPIITAVSRDLLRQVPPSQVEGTVALGATWWQSTREMLFFARSGLFGAVMLGLSRAAGETMAVTMVIGNNTQIVPSPIAPAQTMSSLLATEFAEASADIHRAALCEVALILLAMSLVFNVAARWLVVGKSAGRAGAAF